MDTLKSATGQATGQAQEHTEEQKKHMYDQLSDEEKGKQTYTEWAKEAYHEQYEKWMPWIEDQYLKWFGGGDNKASYVAKDTLSKTKVTGVPQIDKLQDGVNDLVGGQFGEDGMLQPIGDFASKEGINRSERGGKDEEGKYGAGPAAAVTDPVVKGAKGAGEGVVGGAQSVGSTASQGVKGVSGYVGGVFGGGGGKGEEDGGK